MNSMQKYSPWPCRYSADLANAEPCRRHCCGVTHHRHQAPSHHHTRTSNRCQQTTASEIAKCMASPPTSTVVTRATLIAIQAANQQKPTITPSCTKNWGQLRDYPLKPTAIKHSEVAARATRASFGPPPRCPQLHSNRLPSLRSAVPWTLFVHVGKTLCKWL